MGVNTSQIQIPEVNEQNFQFLGKEEDNNHGQFSVFKNKYNGQILIGKGKEYSTKESYEAEIELCNARLAINLPHMQKLITYQKFEESKLLVFSTYKIFALFEYIEQTLEEDIAERSIQGKFYLESELWCLLNDIIETLSYCEDYDVNHENIKPTSILVTKYLGFKMQDKFLNYNSMNQFEQIKTKLNQYCYLSPILFQNLNNKKTYKDIQHDKVKSDVFSLGITVLEAATLTPIDNCYNYQNYTINTRQIENLQFKLKQNYSNELVQRIKEMMTMDENHRPSFVQLNQKINHSKRIVNPGDLVNHLFINQLPEMDPNPQPPKPPQQSTFNMIKQSVLKKQNQQFDPPAPPPQPSLQEIKHPKSQQTYDQFQNQLIQAGFEDQEQWQEQPDSQHNIFTTMKNKKIQKQLEEEEQEEEKKKQQQKQQSGFFGNIFSSLKNQKPQKQEEEEFKRQQGNIFTNLKDKRMQKQLEEDELEARKQKQQGNANQNIFTQMKNSRIQKQMQEEEEENEKYMLQQQANNSQGSNIFTTLKNQRIQKQFEEEEEHKRQELLQKQGNSNLKDKRMQKQQEEDEEEAKQYYQAQQNQQVYPNSNIFTQMKNQRIQKQLQEDEEEAKKQMAQQQTSNFFGNIFSNIKNSRMQKQLEEEEKEKEYKRKEALGKFKKAGNLVKNSLYMSNKDKFYDVPDSNQQQQQQQQQQIQQQQQNQQQNYQPQLFNNMIQAANQQKQINNNLPSQNYPNSINQQQQFYDAIGQPQNIVTQKPAPLNNYHDIQQPIKKGLLNLIQVQNNKIKQSPQSSPRPTQPNSRLKNEILNLMNNQFMPPQSLQHSISKNIFDDSIIYPHYDTYQNSQYSPFYSDSFDYQNSRFHSPDPQYDRYHYGNSPKTINTRNMMHSALQGYDNYVPNTYQEDYPTYGNQHIYQTQPHFYRPPPTAYNLPINNRRIQQYQPNILQESQNYKNPYHSRNIYDINQQVDDSIRRSQLAYKKFIESPSRLFR